MEIADDIKKLTAQFATMQSGMGSAVVALQMARELIEMLYQENEGLRQEIQRLRSAQEKPVLQ